MDHIRGRLSPVVVGLIFFFGLISPAFPNEPAEAPENFEDDIDIQFDASEWEAMDIDPSKRKKVQ